MEYRITSQDSLSGPIGVFDSGYGGLTVLKEIVQQLPAYDYIYLGDNARTPYGTRSFETVHQYTLECVQKLFDMGCRLVILACNTASAKALRQIQQEDLPKMDASRRVLGVIRPTTEIVGKYSRSGKVGVLGTNGTVSANSYPIEISKFYPQISVFQEACPMWVPLVENREHDNDGTDFFIKKNLDNLFTKSKDIDVIILGCTHYPLLMDKIKANVPADVTILSQGKIVAESLADYLIRHLEMETRCSKNGKVRFYTTDSTELFNKAGSMFWGDDLKSEQVII